MEALRGTSGMLAAGAFLALALCLPATCNAQEALFSQAAAVGLEHRYGGGNLSWLLLDAAGNVMAEHWENADAPVVPGSLVKPFTAVAYGEQSGGVFPQVLCMGAAGRCWLPKGHGRLGLEEAIAQSCNAYFLALAEKLDHQRASATLAHYGLAGPPVDARTEAFAGLSEAWKETPLALARAYLQLSRDRHEHTVQRITNGMRASAQRGTARGVDAVLGPGAAIAKTGTAPCSHTPRGAADGFAVVMYPADQPRLLLLVRAHGVTGAETAKTAGAMLLSLGLGNPARIQ